MRCLGIGVHDGLIATTRLPSLTRAGRQVTVAELATLLLMGIVAALVTTFLDLGLRMPGHSIIRAVFPAAFGLALVPRRAAGSVMGASALATVVCLRVGGWTGMGTGAMTSLVLTGPLLDLSLLRARPGWRLYGAFVLAGIGSNMAALAVRGATRVAMLDQSGGRRLAEWLPEAVVTYTLCGAIAGLVSAAFWFRYSGGHSDAAGTVG